MLECINVELGFRSYNIYLGFEIFNKNKIQNLLIHKKKYFLITNETVKRIILDNSLYNSSVLSKINQKYILKDGELYKNIKEIESIISFLLKNECSRDKILIALGGGVIGDMTGFVASIFQRGMKFIQIPTTLLAQVDASIGGKTGVNHALGKNMIGSFWQPSSVFIDIKFLSFLPKKQILSGVAEIIKYAIILDNDFFFWLENNLFSILQLKKEELLYCIKKCCEIKTKIVVSDEQEYNDRILLNLGHSFAHAIETHTKYDKWLHGYAVSAGIVMSAYCAYSLNILNYLDLVRIIKIFYIIGLPIIGPDSMSANDYVYLMCRDKKVLNNKIRLVLPVSIGSATVYTITDKSQLLQIINDCYKEIPLVNK